MSERPHTAIVLPVPEAAGMVQDPHIALIDPFLAPELVDDGVLRELRELFAALVPFPFVLGEPAQFPSGSPYLPPQPVAAFRRIAHEVRRAFPELVSAPTALASAVPHLWIPADVHPDHPVRAHAREAQLRFADGSERQVTFAFGTSAA